MYHVECTCGQRVPVELFQAGTTTQCPGCHSSVAVPGTTKLKLLSGDPYPHLRPVEKLRKTLANGEPPFHGICHHCGEQQAESQVPIHFDVVVERHIQDESPVQLRGVDLAIVVPAAEELHETTEFPLLLCHRCLEEFRSEMNGESTTRWITRICLVIIGVSAAIFCARRVPGLVDLLGRAFWLIWIAGALIVIRMTQRRKTINNVLGTWVKKIRWVPEALAVEDEFKLTAGKAQPYEQPS